MYIDQFIKRARAYADAGVAVQLISAPGIGKSEAVEYLVKKFSAEDGYPWGFGSIFLATYTPPDLMGFMVPGRRKVAGADGTEEEIRVSEFTMPPWMFDMEGRPLNEYKRGIAFVDEYDKAEPDVKRGSAEFVLKGQIGRWKLHSGIWRVIASNRSEDRSGSTKDFDFVINRRHQLHLKANIPGWENWALEHGVDPMFVLFAKKNPEVVFAGKIPDKQGPFCTPRSLVMLARMFEHYKDPKSGKHVFSDRDELTLATEDAAGMIGEGAAIALMTWMEMRTETPDIEQIVADPVGTKVPVKPDAKMLVAYECAHRATRDWLKPICQYIDKLPAEFAVMFGLALIKRNASLIVEAPMREYIKKHKALMVAVGS